MRPPVADEATPTRAPAGPSGEASTRNDVTDHEKVRVLFDRVRKDAAHNPARLERDSQDILNHMLYRGGPKNHWVWRNPSSGLWEERPYNGDDGLPAWVPRCVVNEFANKIDGITSLLVQSDPAKTARPATDDDDDIAAANVVDRALPVLEDEIGWPDLKTKLSHLIALTDKVAVIYYYDNDPKYGSEELPLYQCHQCLATNGGDLESALLEAPDVDLNDAACPTCGSDTVTEAFYPEQHPNAGLPITLTYAKGKLCAELLTSFDFSIPASATHLDADRLPWVWQHSRMDVEEVVASWPDQAEAIRECAGKEERGGVQQTRQYARQLQQLSAPTSTRAGSGGASGGDKTTGVTVHRLQHNPIVDAHVSFPQGLYAVMVGEHILEAGPLPVEDAQTKQRRKSILLRTYRAMPATAFGKPPGDDLAPLQMQRNLLETLAFMSEMHHAAPTTYLPLAVTLEDEPTNMPGSFIRYRSHDPQQRPTREQGTGVHPSVFEHIDRIDAKMDSLSNLNAILQGKDEKATTTLGEAQMRQERGMAAFKVPLLLAVDFETKQSRLLVDIARQNMWSRRFRRILGENGQWQVDQFAAADLKGNVDITIDPATAWPKSLMMQQMRLETAVGMGVIQPAADPEAATHILEAWSLEDHKPSLDNDRKQVARELDRWKAATLPQEIRPPNLAVIEVPIHLHLKKQFLKTEEAEDLERANPAVYAAMVAHVQLLQTAMLPPPVPGPGPGQPGGPPPDGSSVDAAVGAGVLVPEGAQGDPMQAAVEGGALVPEAAAMAMQPPGASIDDLMAARVMEPVLPEEWPSPPA